MTDTRRLLVLTAAAMILSLAGTESALAKSSVKEDIEGRDGSWHSAAQGSPGLASAKKKVESDPLNAAANNDLGWAYRQHGELDASERYLREAIKLKSDMGQAHSNLSVVLLDKGSYAEALLESRKSVEIDAKNPVYRVVYGNALCRNGERKAAIQEYRAAVDLKPDYENALYNLGRVLSEDGQTAQAKLMLSQALKYDSADARVLKLLDQLAGDTVGGGKPGK